MSALAAGCGDAGDSPGEPVPLATTIDTVGGWVRVANSGAPPEWSLELLASVGPGPAIREATPGDFGEAVSVALGPNEAAVYVADRQNCEIRVFGLDGAHQRTFGRCGEGPGEFSPFFYSIAWVGDKLLAYDFGGSRIGEISAEGEWTGQRSVLGAMGGGPGYALYVAGGGEAYAYAMGGGVDQSSGQVDVAYVGHDASGETGDVVQPLDPPENSGGPTCSWGEGYFGFFSNPFAPSLLQVPGPGGTLYSGMSDKYRIAVTRGTDTLRVIERELPPEPVADEEWDALSGEFDAYLEERQGASCEPRRPNRPSAQPFMEDFFLDSAGRLWVEVRRTVGNRWEIFDPEGRLIAQMPAHERKKQALPALGTGHAATIRQDSLDLDHVDIWRIATTAAR